MYTINEWARHFALTDRGGTAICRAAAIAVKNVNAPRNCAKRHWREYGRRRLFWLFLVEVWELFWALVAYRNARRDRDALKRLRVDTEEFHRAEEDAALAVQKARRHVEHEAGDCVAFLAFLIDCL